MKGAAAGCGCLLMVPVALVLGLLLLAGGAVAGMDALNPWNVAGGVPVDDHLRPAELG